MTNRVISTATQSSTDNHATYTFAGLQGDNLYLTNTGSLLAFGANSPALWITYTPSGIATDAVVLEGDVYSLKSDAIRIDSQNVNLQIDGSVSGINGLDVQNGYVDVTIGSTGNVYGTSVGATIEHSVLNSTFNNAGTVRGKQVGLQIAGPDENVRNSGLIEGDRTAGIELGGFATHDTQIVNYGRIASAANVGLNVPPASAILIHQALDTRIINYGTIDGALSNVGVDPTDVQRIVIKNFGVWNAEATGLTNSGVGLNLSSDVDTVVNKGTILGPINFGDGNDTLESTAIGVVTGTVSGGNGNDQMYGGQSIDTFSGDAGNDTLYGNAGDDSLSGGDNTDTLIGGSGDDGLSGGAGTDTLTGGSGDDNLQGGDGNDSVSGNGGVDAINGGDGNDTLNGNAGDDSIIGGAGNDTINGGGGDDTVDTGTGDNTVHGNGGEDAITGGTGIDTIYGDGGDDSIIGNSGSDTISGGGGDDVVDTGTGDNTAHGNGGDDTITGGTGVDALYGDGGNDTIIDTRGLSGTEMIRGGGGNDVISVLDGDAGDTIFAYGDDGNDTINAGGAGLIIDGGTGDDTINLAHPQDTIVRFSQDNWGHDVITGFTAPNTGYDTEIDISGGGFTSSIVNYMTVLASNAILITAPSGATLLVEGSSDFTTTELAHSIF